jgi:hypothetical protein
MEKKMVAARNSFTEVSSSSRIPNSFACLGQHQPLMKEIELCDRLAGLLGQSSKVHFLVQSYGACVTCIPTIVEFYLPRRKSVPHFQLASQAP